MSLLIQLGTVITAATTYKADIYIENGTISAIGNDLKNKLSCKPDKIVNAKEKFILPGVIDPHTHLSMPFMGTESQDDYKTGTIAAACGGTTSIVDFVIQKKGESIEECVNRKKKIAYGNTAIDYSLHPAITDATPEVIREIEAAIKDYGTPSFKLFMTYSFRVNDKEMLEILNETKKHNGIVQVHAENFYIIEYMNDIFRKSRKIAPIYHAKSRPNIAEEEAVSRVIDLVKVSNSRVYIVHLSTKEALAKIIEARENGYPVFSETCPQYLLLTEDRYNEPGWNGAKYVMSPPLRKKEDNNSLWKGLKRGYIQTIGTDHCPFDFTGKKDMFGKNDYTKIPNGAPGIETNLMLMHSEGVNKGKITINELVKLTSTNSAKILGLKDKGEIAIGKDADIVIFDPKQEFTITNEKLHMNVDYNPYEGMKITGMPYLVYSRGKEVAKWDGNMMKFTGKPGSGKFIYRKLTY